MQPSIKRRISSIARVLRENLKTFRGIREANVSLDYSDTVSQHDVSKCEMPTSMVSVILLKRCQTYSNKRRPRLNAAVRAVAKK